MEKTNQFLVQMSQQQHYSFDVFRHDKQAFEEPMCLT